jgi:hypothetical protein
VAIYVTYLVVVGVFVGLVVVSVVRSVRLMTPPRQTPWASPSPVGACVQRAEGLFRELEQQRNQVWLVDRAQRADAEWVAFRRGWLQRFRVVEAQCAANGRNRKALRPLFARLETLLDLYTTHAVQYAGEMGGAIDAFRAELKRIKSN